MKQLQEILYKCPITKVSGGLEIQVTDFHFDSRHSVPGSLFVAVKGSLTDGHEYIDKAIENGAIAIVCEELPKDLRMDITFVQVKDSAFSLACIAGNFYDNPASKMKIVGITGTNGKTTTATLLHRLFNELGYLAGLISTVDIRIGEDIIPSSHTTPDAKTLHKLFRQMHRAGCQYCFMEVSSHAIHQKRSAGVPFAGAVFSNITHDHLDYHGSFAEYLSAKQGLFNELKSTAFALTNIDDRNGRTMLQNTRAVKRTYSLRSLADYKGRIVESTFHGLNMEVDNRDVWFRLIGNFNAHNLLAVYGVARELGIDQDELLLEMSRLEGVNGRFEPLIPKDRKFTAIVDYAHTPDALKNVLATIRDIGGDEGKIITVVGCGGNRDKDKRPIMGQIAAELSEKVIITSDNPRFEEPAEIIKEIQAGVSPAHRRRVLTVENRGEAIAVACSLAEEKDIILVAGKGHETYQEIQGVKHPFDDKEVLLRTFKKLS